MHWHDKQGASGLRAAAAVALVHPFLTLSLPPSLPPSLPSRQDALVLAFQSLLGKDDTTGTISKELVAYVLQRLLPWYSSEKIAALMKFVDRVRREGGREGGRRSRGFGDLQLSISSVAQCLFPHTLFLTSLTRPPSLPPSLPPPPPQDNNEDDDSSYDFDRFSLLMTAVGDDRLHTVRATVTYPCNPSRMR